MEQAVFAEDRVFPDVGAGTKDRAGADRGARLDRRAGRDRDSLAELRARVNPSASGDPRRGPGDGKPCVEPYGQGKARVGAEDGGLSGAEVLGGGDERAGLALRRVPKKALV